MICFKCGNELDFATNPIGNIVRLAPNDIRMYCKKCCDEIDNMLKSQDLSILEED